MLRRPQAWLRGLAALTTVGMFAVLVMGATVTNTGSAEGCGRSWPLCNGQFVPEFTVATAIEYSHRAVTGVESVLVVALTVAMLRAWRGDREVLVLAALMVGTLGLQAGLGAGAVLMPQSPLVLATHFGVSLIAFAATLSSAAVVFERTRGAPNQGAREATGAPNNTVTAEGTPAVRQRLRSWVVGVGVYVLGVVYVGAYVRHANISLACADWPLCNGQLVPTLEGPTAVVFAHRVAAIGVLVLLVWLARLASEARIGQRAAWASLGLAVLQAGSGAVVVWTRLGLFSTLAHAAIMALLFATLALLTRQVVVRRAARVPRPIVAFRGGLA
ncbi:MAG: COX15/CtaA family protein [Chloroflexi bacterium]|nr:COX15/CtaA family protein [Chloroflexota bacterium]